jgi:hypothetical protein
MPDAPNPTPAKEAPRTLIKPTDIEQWTRNHFEELDKNKDGGIDSLELFRSYRNQKLSTTDSAMVLAMLKGFSIIDKQDKEDHKISKDDVAALTKKYAAGKDAELKQKWNEAIGFGNERVSGINDKLWGEFKKPVDAIKSDAIGQGMVGDCWFLASVAAVADTIPHVIEKMITQTPDGKFTVTFPGLADKPVTVDPPSNIELAMFAKSTKYGTWVAVLEKAAAKVGFKKSAEDEIGSLDGGDPAKALQLLTGCKTITLAGDEINVRQKLAVAQQWGLPIVCGTGPEKTDKERDERGVYFSHAYTATYDPRDRKVQVRNPWGWSRDSEPTLPDGRPVDGIADGAFKLSVEDFRKSFRTICIVSP